MDKLSTLNNFVKTLELSDSISVDKITITRELIKRLKNTVNDALLDKIVITSKNVNDFKTEVNSLLENSDTINDNMTTEGTIETFQLEGSVDDVNILVAENSKIPPERGTIIQKLWKVKFKDGTTGYAIFSDTSNEEFSKLVNAQLSTALITAPPGSIENLDKTILISDLRNIIKENASRDLTNIFVGLEKPGLTARQLRDIDIDADPELTNISNKNDLKVAIAELNSATTEEEITIAQGKLQSLAEKENLYSTSIGPTPNNDYSDLKRFKLQKDDNTIVEVTMSMPIISWGPDIPGIPIRNDANTKDIKNRKDDGMSYIIDLGGFDPVIRDGKPNPLPATRFYNYGPPWATAT